MKPGIKMKILGKRNNKESLGLDKKPGDAHYRAFVGPPEDYDLIAAMAFNLLTTLGLRQYHRLLDIGCGSLRIGRLLIPYLNEGHYTGIEPNKWLVEEGIQREIGKDLIRIKKPNFVFSDNAKTLPREIPFDFALAQSIFSHCTLELIERWLLEISEFLKPDGVLVATFKKGDKDYYHENGITEEDIQGDGWIYPKGPYYKVDTMRALAIKTGFRFQRLDWAHPRQTWAIFAKEHFDSSWFENAPLTWSTFMNSRFGSENKKQK
jgi:SAM-dependent methyltransferase